MKNRLIFTLICYFFVISASAQITLLKNGKSSSRIVVDDDDNDRKAAVLFQNLFQKAGNTTLPIVVGQPPRKGDVLIGNKLILSENLREKQKTLSEDGFAVAVENGVMQIVGGGDKGSIYGVVWLFETHFGMDYWSENAYSVPLQKNVVLPRFCNVQNPSFSYRQSQSYGMQTDSIYRMFLRLEEPREVFAGGYWVHTFDRLLPSSVYGKNHPEYYSYFNGKRHPGKASQWCLTNPDVLEIVAAKCDSIFKANPNKDIISVSQNDGNYTNCTCEHCKKIDDYEGSPSGSLIYFINKLAERFPDKKISTLAYLYTMKAPKHIRPRSNVVVILCDIDCMREVSLTENKTGREFTEALESWGKITENLFVWDYGINFDNYLSPFPNFHILQDNIQLFHKNNTSMHFSQIAGSRGGNFSELRVYLVSKLMWDKDVDTDSLTQHFLHGYYGEAAPYLYQYIKIMEGAVIAGGQPLWIYDSPVSYQNGMLKPELMRRYQWLFDQAERAVASSDVLLKRVQMTRLPIQYSELEILRTQREKDFVQVGEKLNLFEQRVKEFNVPRLNEGNNSPSDYCELYRQRYMKRAVTNLAQGANIIFDVYPTGKYKNTAQTWLTDGLFGGSTFVESWIGWEGTDAVFTIDLGNKTAFEHIETDFLHQLGQWILLPKSLTYSVSDDNVHFTEISVNQIAEDRSPQVKFYTDKVDEKITARYIKITVEGTKECPHWHYGVGHPSWFFIDEITVF